MNGCVAGNTVSPEGTGRYQQSRLPFHAHLSKGGPPAGAPYLLNCHSAVDIQVHVDGSAMPNAFNGSTGAGIVIKYGNRVSAYGVPLTPGTNNKAELLAFTVAFDLIRQGGEASTLDWKNTFELSMFADSEYAINSISGVWGLKSSSKNRELIMEARAAAGLFKKVRYVHEYGHVGNAENELANTLAQKASGERLATFIKDGEELKGPAAFTEYRKIERWVGTNQFMPDLVVGVIS